MHTHIPLPAGSYEVSPFQWLPTFLSSTFISILRPNCQSLRRLRTVSALYMNHIDDTAAQEQAKRLCKRLRNKWPTGLKKLSKLKVDAVQIDQIWTG